MLRVLGKSSLVMSCTAAGLMGGYVSYLLASLALLMIYGDDGQGGHPGVSYIRLASWLVRALGNWRTLRGFETEFKDVQRRAQESAMKGLAL